MKPDPSFKATPANYPGKSAFRLDPKQQNPREVAFATQWLIDNDEKSKTCILSLLLDGKPTQRDEQVAATVIQWLGSNCGMSFLDEVARESQWVRDWFRRCGGSDVNYSKAQELRAALIEILNLGQETCATHEDQCIAATRIAQRALSKPETVPDRS